MSALELKVGFTYRNTNGCLLNIVSQVESSSEGILFEDTSGWKYFLDGRFYKLGLTNQPNLVEEIGAFHKPTLTAEKPLISSIPNDLIYTAICKSADLIALMNRRGADLELIKRETCDLFRTIILDGLSKG